MRTLGRPSELSLEFLDLTASLHRCRDYLDGTQNDTLRQTYSALIARYEAKLAKYAD